MVCKPISRAANEIDWSIVDVVCSSISTSFCDPALRHPSTSTERSAVVATKDKQLKIDTVSMCQMLARALRDLLARYCDPHLQRPTL